MQADLKSFTALQCYGSSVITALTAQNTLGVQDIHAVPPSFVTRQVRMSPNISVGNSTELQVDGLRLQ